MVLGINDTPKLKHPKDVDRVDPYETTLEALSSGDSEVYVSILKGEKGVRQLAAVPTALLTIDPTKYAGILRQAKQQGVEQVLLSCFRIARSLATDYSSPVSEELETIAATADLSQSPLLYEEFRHMYVLYGKN